MIHAVDIGVILLYLIATIAIGFWVSKRTSKNLSSYFLGGRTLPWYMLGISNASGMFDITGTMWMVSICFMYGLKSVWLPWIWPMFNQIFLMIYLSIWLRRSNVMTGAEWITTRFGTDRGAQLAHISVVIFALLTVIGMIAYAFKGIGKFSQIMLPWDWHENIYALIILSLTSLYVIKGGMISVVLTEVLQFLIMTVASVAVGLVAIAKVSPETIAQLTPRGWMDPFFGWRIDLNWTGILDSVNASITKDGFSLFTIFFMLMLFKGVLASMAGPTPNYDMQRVLATRSPREASLMSGFVNVVLYIPRYMLVAGLTILALAHFMPDLQGSPEPDFEQLLPHAIQQQWIPVGLSGLLLAGLFAAFMSTFAATVNAGPAYIVNDIYKRFINPHATDRMQIRMSYAASLVVVVVGIGLGFAMERIADIMNWIFGALYGGYVAANVLKWHWWRFNAYGYFWGMIAGIVGTLVVLAVMTKFFPDVHVLYGFPAIFALSVIGCIVGCLMTRPEEDEILMAFYRNVRPWGFWEPIRQKVLAQNPDFTPNKDFRRDMFNVLIGLIWQISLVTLPIYLVVRHARGFWISLAVVVVTSVILKLNWLDKLPEDSKPA